PVNSCECIPKLPVACPQGQYHPYPIGHAQQDLCEPFPQTQTQNQQQKQQTTQQQQTGSGGSKQQQQQQQQQPSCPTYCKHPQTGQWYRTPSGYHCDPQTQVCTPDSQQQQQTGCSTGYCKHPVTGQWIATPAGYYCNPQTQTCT